MEKLSTSTALTQNTADRSDRSMFSFSFFCDCCGKEWISPSVPFTFGGFNAIEHEEAKQLLWAQEHREALVNANAEARMHFNRCSVCGKWVCDDCFQTDSGDVCKDCVRATNRIAV